MKKIILTKHGIAIRIESRDIPEYILSGLKFVEVSDDEAEEVNKMLEDKLRPALIDGKFVQTKGRIVKYIEETDSLQLIDPPKPRVPSSIANWRCKRILEKNNLLDAVEQSIQSLEEPIKGDVLAAWIGGAEVARNGNTVKMLSGLLGLTDDQIDSMFIEAAQIKI